MEAFDSFDYDALAEAGVETVEIEYAGSNDEGYINDISADPEPEHFQYGSELYRDLEQAAYDVLEKHYAGWEINEGADGKIKVIVKERKAELTHGEIRHVHDWTTIDV